ncbi:hypothetical protein [Flavobacterium nitratireducens]|uniref:hypothetical protein n=1 Tax=Flavobacterium nitratireducens TaxID=992289 RepID=UPI002415585F|nr:hypothetical protein [Flavobacterium nitratireducens]
MKTIKLFIAAFILFATTSQAQVSVNVNIGAPPAWGPVGYSNIDYYYLPDIECYYDIRLSQFIYFGNGRWIHSRNLPVRYRNYDLYRGYKVVLNDYHGRTPYVYFKNHKAKYYKGYKGKPQKNIGYHHHNGNHKHHKGNWDKHNSDHGHKNR